MSRNYLTAHSLIHDISDAADKATQNPELAHDLQDFSYAKVAARTGVMIAVTAAAAAAAWAFLPTVALSFIIMLPIIIGIAVLGVVAGHKLLKANPIGLPMAFAYCVLEGGILGWFSRALDARYGDGIVAQAVLATLVTAAVVVAYSRTSIGKKTGRAVGAFVAASIGYLIFLLVDLFLGLLGVGGGWGIHGLGIIGLGVCLLGCLLAAWSLNVDVVAARDLEGARVPDTIMWASAFSITLSLLWMYLEVLQLLAIAND